MRVRVLLLTALFALVLVAPAAASPRRAGTGPAARLAETFCRKTLHFNGEPYGVLTKGGTTCRFAVRWTKRYQRQGLHPPHWSCVGREEFTEDGSCQDRRGDGYFEYYIED